MEGGQGPGHDPQGAQGQQPGRMEMAQPATAQANAMLARRSKTR